MKDRGETETGSSKGPLGMRGPHTDDVATRDADVRMVSGKVRRRKQVYLALISDFGPMSLVLVLRVNFAAEATR